MYFTTLLDGTQAILFSEDERKKRLFKTVFSHKFKHGADGKGHHGAQEHVANQIRGSNPVVQFADRVPPPFVYEQVFVNQIDTECGGRNQIDDAAMGDFYRTERAENAEGAEHDNYAVLLV